MSDKDNILKLLKTIDNCIEKLNKKRHRKINFKHLFYTRFLGISQNFGVEISTSHLQNVSKIKVSYQSVQKAIKNYSFDLGNSLKGNLIRLFPKSNRRFLAVDGSTGRLNKSIGLKDTNFKLTKNGTYTKSLITTVYDVDNKLPIFMNLRGSRDERSAFLDCLKYLRQGDCLIFDRGYYSASLEEELKQKGIDYIFRLKCNSSIIKNPPAGAKIVTFSVRNTTYFILTSLKVSEDSNFYSNLYHKRWEVEEWYKKFKYQLGGNFFTQKSLDSVLEVMNWQQIVTIIYAYLDLSAPKVNNKGAMSYGKEIALILSFNAENRADNLLELLGHVKISLKSFRRPNRHFERKSITYSGKWYITNAKK